MGYRYDVASSEWVGKLAILSGLVDCSGQERITTPAVFEFLQVPLNERTTGAARYLRQCMEHLGWKGVKYRPWAYTSRTDMARGYERAPQSPTPTIMHRWVPTLAQVRGKKHFDGTETVTTRQLCQAIGLRTPSKGYYQDLTAIMVGLGWQPIRVRDTSLGVKGQYTPQVRGFIRRAGCPQRVPAQADIADTSQMLRTLERKIDERHGIAASEDVEHMGPV